MEATSKFPIYQPDQVLSANHLNQSLAYLEKHDRLSRRLLHGIGIVCGLEFSVEKNTLTITKGCGITSEGYLIAVEKPMVLTKVRDYIPPYPPKYNPFYDGNDKPFTLWEAVPETEAEGENLQNLGKLELSDKVLLLYLELRDKDLKECVGDDCDNLGMVREFTLRPLIIAITDLIKIFNQDGNTVEDIVSSVFARYSLQEVVPPRFDVTPKNATTATAINNTYASLCDNLMPELKKALASAEVLFAASLGMPATMNDALKKLDGKLAKARGQEMGQQYFFDHLCDIAAAYNEFIDVATRWMVTCMPDEDDFPRHLALGEFAQIKEHQPKIFRHYFKHASAAPEANRQQKHVRFLYERLLKIIYNFELRKEKEVLATPSRYAQALSEKAIPYYYNPESKADVSWLLGWSFAQRERGAWMKTAHYHNKPQQLLMRDIEFNSFFRIEGYLGKKYTEALAAIKEQINEYRLPVKVVALSTGSVPFDLSLLEECRTKDLDAQFDAAREALLCQLRDVAKFIAGIPTDIKPQKPAGTTGAGASNMFIIDVAAMAKNINYSSYLYTNKVAAITGSSTTDKTKSKFIESVVNQPAENTVANMYFELAKTDYLKNASLIDVLGPKLDLTGLTPDDKQISLAINYSAVVLDQIEEMAAILSKATVSTLNFKALSGYAKETMGFIRTFVAELSKLEEERGFTLHPMARDLKHHLVHLAAMCKMQALFSIYKTYKARIQAALEELQFARFIAKHPGIDHKAGVTKGGTFILVYHSRQQREEAMTFEPNGTETYNPKAPVRYMYQEMTVADAKAFSPKATDLTKEKLKNDYLSYAKEAGKQIDKDVLERLDEFFKDVVVADEDQTRLEEGTVFADFYLPYICCSDCGGIEINISQPAPPPPAEPITVSLDKETYCEGDIYYGRFTVSPAGGKLTGKGSFDERGTLFLDPAGLTPGTYTYTYTLNGQSATTQATVLPAPKADFTITQQQEGQVVVLEVKGLTTNAKEVAWFVDGKKTSDSPSGFQLKVDEKATSVTLRMEVSNGQCMGTKEESIQIIRTPKKEYSLQIGKNKTEFCSNEDIPYGIEILIKGVGAETRPFDGVIKGKGVIAPTQKTPYFAFNPAKAGAGEQVLVYVVGGKEVASLALNVVPAFPASFKAETIWEGETLLLSISDIKPADATAYYWEFFGGTAQQPLERKNNKSFMEELDYKLVAHQSTITVKMRAAAGICEVPTELAVLVNPKPSRTNNPVINNPNITPGAFEVKPVGVNNPVITWRSGNDVNVSNPRSRGEELMASLAEMLKKPADQTKLTSGALNNDLAKQFDEVLNDLQGYITKNRTSLDAPTRNQWLEFYAQVAGGLVNYIAMQKADLKATEALAKTFTALGDGLKAMASSMPATTRNGIKDKLSTLANQRKPVAAGIASSINKAV